MARQADPADLDDVGGIGRGAEVLVTSGNTLREGAAQAAGQAGHSKGPPTAPKALASEPTYGGGSSVQEGGKSVATVYGKRA